MTIKKFKTIYFIYNADGGLLNEIKYWINKNLLRKQIACELCDILTVKSLSDLNGYSS